jgi:hypothetical protein
MPLLAIAGDYWGWFGSRSYHHTGPVSTFYAMREALQIVADEGLENMWARHLARHQQLWEGLSSMGLKPYVENDADRWVVAGAYPRVWLRALYRAGAVWVVPSNMHLCPCSFNTAAATILENTYRRSCFITAC